MNKTASKRPLLQLLVKLYNQTIQSYHHFPDVILCGSHRLEKEEFELLLLEGLVEPHYTDSFGTFYHLSVKGYDILLQSLHKRKTKSMNVLVEPKQVCLPF